MGGRGGSPNSGQAAAAAAAPASAETQIRRAYDRLATKPGAWVRLTDIRAAFSANDRASVDDALRGLADAGNDAHFIPVANLKSLSPEDRNAAIKIGGELKHLIAIDPGSR